MGLICRLHIVIIQVPKVLVAVVVGYMCSTGMNKV
jgi:hypothetical protein